MSRFTYLWICLGLFIAPILSTLLLSPFLTSPVANYLFNSKVQELLAGEKERKKLLENNMVSQIPRLKFDCGTEDMALLRDPSYYNRHIRFAGIQSAEGQTCSTLGPGLPILSNVLDTSSVTGFGITATLGSIGSEREFIVYSKHSGNLVYWVINNSWVHDLLQNQCIDCYYIEFTHYNNNLNGVYVPRGDETIKYQPGAISKSDFDSLKNVEETLWAGDKLRSYAAHQVRYYGLLISSAVGMLLVTGFLLLRNYKNSLNGLLNLAIERKEFVPFYQPVIDVSTHEIVGYEALIRWRKGDEFIPPSIFIDYAERQGLIMPMTTQLVSKIVADLELLTAKHWVSVNLVAAHVEDSHLENMLMKLQWPDPNKLMFEITERIPIADIKSAAREIARLGLRGYRFKIDDFGTGYGGFTYIQQLGIRSIKIDKMFVDTIGTTDLKRSVLDAIIAFGRESKMEMIAEGVETQEQVDYLFKRGVFLMQGYVFAKPMPLEDIAEWESVFKGKKTQVAQVI